MASAESVILSVSPAELQRRIDQGENPEMLDVRTPAEHGEVHAVGVNLVPLDKLVTKRFLESRQAEAQAPLYLFCKSGGRALRAAEKFVAAGFDKVIVVDGGTDAWVAAGLPVERGARKVMSLERQVRITAGALVFVGTLLGVLASPWFLVVPGFVGAGLVFAGLTDTCGMGMALARCPWNR